MKTIASNFRNIVLCIGEIIIGFLLFINPVGFTKGIIISLGIILIIYGMINIISYFRTEPDIAMKEQTLTKGVLAVLAGGFCTFKAEWFLITFPVLTGLYGIVLLVISVSKIQWAIDMLRRKQKYWFISAVGALFSVILAVIIISSPFAWAVFLWKVIAFSLIFEAVIDIIALVFESKNNRRGE